MEARMSKRNSLICRRFSFATLVLFLISQPAMTQESKSTTLELQGLKREFPALIKEIRGSGLMVGAELTREGETIVGALRERGVLLNCTNTNVLRFLPPLIIREEELSAGIQTLREVLKVS